MALSGRRKTSSATRATSEKTRSRSNGTSQATLRLIKALRSADEAVRVAAVKALGATGDRKAVPGLINCLYDHSPDVRQSAAQSLGWLQDSTAIPHLLSGLHDPDPAVMMTAALAIQWIGDPGAIPGLLEVARTSQDLAVQQVVHSTLEELSGRVIDEMPLRDHSNGRHAKIAPAPESMPLMPVNSESRTDGNSPAPAASYLPHPGHTSAPTSPEELWVLAATETTQKNRAIRQANPDQTLAGTVSRWRQVSGVLSMMSGLTAIIGGLGISLWGGNLISSGPVLGISVALVGIGLVLAGWGQLARSPLLGIGIVIAGTGCAIIGGLYTVTGWIYLGKRPGLSGWGLAAIGIWLLLVGVGTILYGTRHTRIGRTSSRRSR